jgi:tRNA dimethylallyltransferase
MVHLLILTGPTAVGKSAVALYLAEQLGGEIVSADSMQVYRGLDIGTAKPSSEERRRVRHHLIDILDLSQAFDAAQFVQLAADAVTDIKSRGRLPILCGGTGLYLKAFVHGLGDAPAGNSELRAELEKLSLADLLRELADNDPKTYEKIDRKNPRRVIRAVEVQRLTGKPFSDQRVQWINGKATVDNRMARVGLSRVPADLRLRIGNRVESMFRAGLVAETRKLLELGLAENKVAMQSLGYRQVVAHLRGERNLSETIELVKIRTRQFAKRQMTWFKRQLDLKWIELKADTSPVSVATQIAQGCRAADSGL